MSISPRRRILASATLDPRGVAGVIPVRGEGSRPWSLYRQVSEYRSGVLWLADAISRADLFIARRTPDGDERVTDQWARDILDELFGTGPSQGDMLKQATRHVEVAGETFLVPIRQDGSAVWFVASGRELISTGTEIEFQIDVNTRVPLAGEAIRIWSPDPEIQWKAESPAVAMEVILSGIAALSSRMAAVGESRLAGNGVLALADTLSIASPTSEGDANPVHERDFYSAFVDSMVSPMTDRGLVSGVVPLLITGPKEDLPTRDSYITLASPLDERASEQLDQLIKRLAISMAIPPEILTGLGDTNHWSAASILREAAVTVIEPRVELFASALNPTFLRPRLERRGVDPAEFTFAVDLSDLFLSPDRSQEAQEARERGWITNEAWARHEGFEASDLPTGSERKRILLELLLRQDPGTAPWVLPELGISIPGFTVGGVDPDPPAVEPPSADSPDSPDPLNSLPDDPGTEPDTNPDRGVSASLGVEDAVVLAVESAVLRVLERAGNRLVRNGCARPLRAHLKDVPPINVHTVIQVGGELREKVLKGSYDVWAERMPALVPLVDSYVNYLFDQQLPHSRELLADTLAKLADHWPGEAPCPNA